MTRRAFRPRVSAAGAAPVISKADGLPCGAFGSITVLIFSSCLSRARGGREARSSPAVEKIAALTARRLSCGSGTSRLVWPGGEKVPVPRWLTASHGTRNRLVPNGAKNTPGEFACQEYSTIYWVSLFDCSQ